jgi:hAT family C-terminal dimerisation region
MKQQPVKRDTDVYKYWASKEYEFPIIARIARDYLAIPAISAASECVFSVGGDIVTKKRNRLGGSNTRRLLYLQDWGVLAEGEDEGSSDIEINLDEELHLIIYIIIVRLLILVRIFANSTRVLIGQHWLKSDLLNQVWKTVYHNTSSGLKMLE